MNLRSKAGAFEAPSPRRGAPSRRWISLVVALVPALGCTTSSVSTDVDCTTATVPTYAELGSSLAYCTSCHGASRAEKGIRYDTYDAAVSGAQQGADTISDGSMPEDSDMPDAEATAFITWAECGTPE